MRVEASRLNFLPTKIMTKYTSRILRDALVDTLASAAWSFPPTPYVNRTTNILQQARPKGENHRQPRRPGID